MYATVLFVLAAHALAYGSSVPPNFQDGSWEFIDGEDWQITKIFSPAEKFVYTIGKIRRYHKIGSPGQRGEEYADSVSPARAIGMWWNDPERPGIDLHALRTRESGWIVGIGFDIILNVDSATGRLQQTKITLRPIGPVANPPHVIIANPYFVPSTPPQPTPDISHSLRQKKL